MLDEPENPRKAAALALIEQGFHVFAVQKNEKRPDPLLAPNGFHDATTDAETVGGWFDAKPNANIGIACGREHGLVVLDIDTKNGAPGLASFERLGAGEVATLTANTPNGGYHVYFKYPVDVTLKAKHPDYPGIDIKGGGGGGYVVAPPSMLASGAYAWRDETLAIAEMPFEVVAALEQAAEKPCHGPSRGSPVDELKTAQGGRHNKLLQISGVYRGKGLEAPEIEALLWLHAERYFEPPYSRENPQERCEVEQLAYWIGRKAANQMPAELTPLTTAELFALAAREDVPPICDPILPPAGNLMIYGRTGNGKSHLANALAVTLARGGELLEWVVPRALRVLFIDGEMPLQELKARALAYLHGQPAPDTLRWLAARATEDDLPDIADPAAQVLYERAVAAVGAEVVFLDNLTCLRETSAEAPENSVEAWYPVQRFIRRLNQRGVAVVVVHHSAKSGSQRGSSAHTAAMDTVVKVDVTDDKLRTVDAAHDVVLLFEKHRRFFGADALEFRAVATVDPDGFAHWRRDAVDPLLMQVVALARTGTSYRDIAAATRASKSTVERKVALAKSRGLLPLGGAT